MAFIGSMFSNSNGTGYDASQGQGTTTATQNQAAATNGGVVSTPSSASNPFGGNTSVTVANAPTIGDQSAAAASALGATNANLQNQAVNGSSLAQNQLAQATGQNIQNATGMISSAKGLNPALAARQASENATNANQQAGNQSAQLQAQTQMAANQQLSGNLLGQQQIYQGAIANENNNQTAIAQGNQKAQQGLVGGLMNSVGGGLSSLLAQGGVVKKMADGGDVAPITVQATVPSTTGAVMPNQSSGPQSSFGKFLKGATASYKPSGSTGGASGSDSSNPIMQGMSSIGNAISKGIKDATTSSNPPAPTGQAAQFTNPTPEPVVQPGALPVAPVAPAPFADGGDVQPDSSAIASGMGGAKGVVPDGSDIKKGAEGPLSGGAGLKSLVASLANGGKVNGNLEERKAKIAKIIASHQAKAQASGKMGLISESQAATTTPSLAKGGMVPVMLSPGERALSPKDAKAVASGKKDAMKAGKKVPGKPVVGGAKNDYANDTFPTKLAEGSIVIPRSVTQSQDPQGAAHAFVAAHYAKKGHLPGKKKKS